MDEWNSIGRKESEFSGSGANYVALILLVQRLAVFVVLVVGKYTSKDCMELGEASDKGPGKLFDVSDVEIDQSRDYLSQTMEEDSVNQDACT